MSLTAQNGPLARFRTTSPNRGTFMSSPKRIVTMPLLAMTPLLLGAALLTPTMTDTAWAQSDNASIAVALADAKSDSDVDPALIAEAKPVLSSDQQLVADALSEFTAAASGSLDLADREGIAAHYAATDYQHLWMDGDALSTNARNLIFKISRAARYGLDAGDYDLPALGATADTAESHIALDLQMSLAATRFVRHLNSGRLIPQEISSSLDMKPERPDSQMVIAKLATAGDPVKALEDFHPKHPEYHALLKELDQLAERRRAKPVTVPSGKLLRPGARDERVPILRQRLDVGAHMSAVADGGDETIVDPLVYDPTLVEAVKSFQAEKRLTQDGIVGPATLRAMNGGSTIDPRQKILVNLERWRWMPKDMGKFHLFANIPEFRVFVRDEGTIIHDTRVVVGKVKHKTVAFSDQMEHFVVNPSWGVPQSIIKNEMLPAARSNPSYFNARGYQVFARINGRTRRIDPSRVNWNGVPASRISVRQPPGVRNALGRIKFMFPNKHAIYFHDTPSKSLFKRDVRAFSHGCVRIHNPMEFADAILRHHPDWGADRIKQLVGGRETTVQLDEPIPVHIGYFTTAVDQNGKIRFHNDIYGHDARMIKALNL